jgi:hypothetical protein
MRWLWGMEVAVASRGQDASRGRVSNTGSFSKKTGLISAHGHGQGRGDSTASAGAAGSQERTALLQDLPVMPLPGA